MADPLACHLGHRVDLLGRILASAKEHKLSPKETVVLVWMFKGLSQRQIALKTGNTYKTVKHFIRYIYRKFEVDEGFPELVARIFPLDDS